MKSLEQIDDQNQLEEQKECQLVKQTEYQIGQKVVYPTQGVGEIINIESRRIGKLTKFYILIVGAIDCKIMVPFEMVNKVGMRPIIDPNDVQYLFDLMAKKLGGTGSKTWPSRRFTFLQKLKNGTPEEMVEIYREYYWLINTSRKTSFAEMRTYHIAKQIICTEIAFALNSTKKEIAEKIENILTINLENSRHKLKK